MQLTERALEVFRKGHKRDKELQRQEQRSQLKADCEEILTMENFGRGDFEDFVGKMQLLLKQSKDPSSSARLKDKETRRDIDFVTSNNGFHAITVRTEPIYLGDNVYGHKDGTYYESVRYERSNDSAKKLQPRLYTAFSVSLPTNITYVSFVSQLEEKVFPEDRYRDTRSQVLSEEQVQAFCEKVYDVSLLSDQTVQSK